jgi:putative endonuclease
MPAPFHQYWIYILTNKLNSVLYIGVTSDLLRRVLEHHEKVQPGFTAMYSIDKLVYFEETLDPLGAIQREKQLKGWTRQKKERLIQCTNPDWKNLFEELGS